METPEIKSINAKSLDDNALDAVRAKLLKQYSLTDDKDALETAMRLFDYIKENGDKKACLTEEQQWATADAIVDIVEQGAQDNPEIVDMLLMMISLCRVECADCINNACKKRDPLLRM